MNKLLKSILTTLLIGLICFSIAYIIDDIAVRCTISIAYVMFLIIYGIISLNSFDDSTNNDIEEYEVNNENEIEEG